MRLAVIIIAAVFSGKAAFTNSNEIDEAVWLLWAIFTLVNGRFIVEWVER